MCYFKEYNDSIESKQTSKNKRIKSLGMHLYKCSTLERLKMKEGYDLKFCRFVFYSIIM